MMMRRVVINGQSYAVGLDWFPLKEDMKRAELVLEAEGYDEKCDLSVVLEKQYALARSRNRSWKRVRSLAATLVLNKYPDAVHVFPLVDADDDTPFWWVIGVRRGIVSGQTDRCFDTQEDAESVAVSVQDSLGVPELQSFSNADVLLNHTKPTKTSFMNDPAALGHLKDTAGIGFEIDSVAQGTSIADGHFYITGFGRGKRERIGVCFPSPGGPSIPSSNIGRLRKPWNRPAFSPKTRKKGPKNWPSIPKGTFQANGCRLPCRKHSSISAPRRCSVFPWPRTAGDSPA